MGLRLCSMYLVPLISVYISLSMLTLLSGRHGVGLRVCEFHGRGDRHAQGTASGDGGGGGNEARGHRRDDAGRVREGVGSCGWAAVAAIAESMRAECVKG